MTIRANALGRLTGNWVFVGKQIHAARAGFAEDQVWAVPLDRGAPKLAFAFDVPIGGVPEAILETQPYLRRQFSPDGKRMVINASGLAIVDLESGSVTRLGVPGYFPAWSKDGSRIAFVHYLPTGQSVPPEEAIGVVSVAGGPVTDLAKVGYSRQSVEWSPDGSMLVVAQPDQTVIVDATNGRVLRRVSEGAPPSGPFAHWRGATPQIAIAAAVCAPGSTVSSKLVGFDDVNAPERTLVDGRESCPELTIQDPRWNPTGAAEVLYVAALGIGAIGAPQWGYPLHILAVSSGQDTALPFEAYEATWTPDGTEIVYITVPPQLQAGPLPNGGVSVLVSRRDWTGIRELLYADGANGFFFSVASVSY